MNPANNSNDKSRIAVRVKPNSQRSQFLGYNEQRQAIEVALNAPARDGEANEELIELIHEQLKLPKSKIKIVTGLKARDKVLELECSPEVLKGIMR